LLKKALRRLTPKDNQPPKTPPLLHVTVNGCRVVACNTKEANMAHVNSRVQKHRDALRMAGLRPVQIWVPDTRRPDFAEECRRQCRLAAQADMTDTDMQHFMDETLADMDGWTE
jgi:Protein  of unknown function (DUF3018)